MILQTNFIAGKMNKSVDERLVPIGEYVDALNIRLGSTEGTEVGAVENSKGNTVLTSVEYLNLELSPSARCIGAFEDGMRETIYWFVHDSANLASASGSVSLILSYNTNLSSLTYHVVSETVLNFNPAYLITGVNKIGDLLFFTDDFNPPRYINVKRKYKSDTTTVNPLEEEDISVIVKIPGFEDDAGSSPLGQPFIELFHNGTTADYMEDRFLCFAYRYRYSDGGYSATSLFTTPAFEPKAFDFSLETFKNEGMVNKYNSARVHFSTGSDRVTEIQVLYKEAGSNNIYIIDRLNKATQGYADNSFSYLTFTNSKILSLLGSDELLRLYDNVPRLAQAQTIQGNRLMYGNYVDQYDISSSAGGGPVEIRYQVEPQSQATGGISFPLPFGTTGTYNIDPDNLGTAVLNSVATFDLSDAIVPILQGTFFDFSLAIQNVSSTNNGGADVIETLIDDFNIGLNFISDQEYATVDDMLSSQAFQNAIGTDALMAALLPYINPPPPAYPPVAPFPPQSGPTLTDRFNSTVPYAWGDTNPLLLINSSIDGSCTGISPIAPWPPVTDTCASAQEPMLLQHLGDGATLTKTFSLQLPATLYYFDDGLVASNSVTKQFQYFAFNLAETTSSMKLTEFTGSLHSHRDYEVGVVYMDEYGRASTVLVNETNTVFFPASNSTQQNKVKVTLENLPPYWATHYKFVMKPSQGTYETIWTTLSFEQTGCNTPEECGPTPFNAALGNYWFRLEGESQNIVSVGDVLTVKKDAAGSVGSFVTAEVLDKEALYSGQIDGANPAGVYIRLKANGWQPKLQGDSININCSSTKTGPNIHYPLSVWNALAGSPPRCVVDGELFAGSTVRIQVHNFRGGLDLSITDTNCDDANIEWDSGDLFMPDSYPNIHVALLGIEFGSLVNEYTAVGTPDDMTIAFDPVLYTFPSVPTSTTLFHTIIFIQEATVGGVQSVCNQSNIPYCTIVNDSIGVQVPSATLNVKVNFSAGVFCFESEPNEADPNLFYDASDLLEIDKAGYHNAKRIWNPVTQATQLALGSVEQTATVPLQTILDFYNCYSFGNGVESFRIEDRIAGKSFILGQRVLAVSNQDFKEADRFAGMTYSGVYSDSANSNNLNEFNLGLANWKDLETEFGPIMKMHSRETDILILQEDRISYVLAGKNVITDATGGGAIASVPEVLGTQIARIEEFGISFNPESFVSWGSAIFFTDTKRGAVLMLQGASRNNDQLQEVSSLGMRSWFRDQFNDQLTTQKLGWYDPYMDEYVLSTNNIEVPLPLSEIPCGQLVSQQNSSEALSFTVNFGQVIGTINVPYTISSGEIEVSINWNGAVTSSGLVNSSGTFSFNKTSGDPETATVTITPTTTFDSTATYGITFGCPEELTLTVIQVVVSANTYSGQSIHTEYSWNDGVTFSPTIQNAISLNSTPPTSSYISQTGVRSIGAFPYDGASVILRTRKVIPDNFTFNPSIHSFKILSSNTLYSNNAADISLLLTNSTDVTPVNNPSSPVFQAEEVAFFIPDGNQYLYLVWDLREINSSLLCYSVDKVESVCCDCVTSCNSCFFSPVQQSSQGACAVNTDTFGFSSWSYNSLGNIPVLGNTVFSDPTNTCSVGTGVLYQRPGYYIVDQAQPSGATPLNWVLIGAGGIVIDSGTCK